MHVTNREHCTLIIGKTHIGYAQTLPVEPEWEQRCEQMAARGALLIHRGPKADDRHARAMTPAEVFASMSEAERKAAIAAVMGDMGIGPVTVVNNAAAPSEAAAAIHSSLKSEIAKAAASIPTQVADPVTAPIEVPAVPAGAPADFHTCHVNKATAFVRKCSDVALLTALGNDETRESVLAAIIDRVQALEPKAN